MFDAEIDWVSAGAKVVVGAAIGAGMLYLWNRTIGRRIVILGPVIPAGALPSGTQAAMGVMQSQQN